MTSDSWPGATPRLGRGAFAAGFIALGCIAPSTPDAFGASGRSIEFQGELNYDVFKRASAKGTAIRITQSPGGTGAAAMELGRAKGLIIDGRCQSACAWAFVQDTSACFTQRASFDFHAAHDPGTGRRLTAATDYWLSTVGPELRSRLAGLRSSSNLIRVSAKEMTRYYGGRVCGASSRRTDATDPTSRTADATSGTKGETPDASPKSGAAPQVAGAKASPRQFWSNADDEAAIEALLVTQENAGVTVASLLPSGSAGSPETSIETDAAANVIEGVMLPFAATAATDFTGSWPKSDHIVWVGVVASVIDAATELATRRDDATSDG